MANWVQGGPIQTVDNYQDLPFFGQDGDLYFCKDMDKLVVWDKDAEDWKIVNTLGGEHPTIDEHNDRRGAIMAQRKRNVQKPI